MAAYSEQVESSIKAHTARDDKGLTLLVFALVTVLGLGWIWLAPTEHQAEALVQFRAELPGAGSAEQLERELQLQQQLLLSAPVLDALDDALGAFGALTDVQALAGQLEVLRVPGDAQLRLRASATTPEAAKRLLEQWITVYQQRLTPEQDPAHSAASARRAAEIEALELRQGQLREELETLQAEHQTASISRDQARAEARIETLLAARRVVQGEQQRAAAELEALRATRARGELLARPQDQPEIDNLRQRALRLEDQLRGLRERYTDAYLRINREAQALRHRLTETQTLIAERQQQSQQQQLQRAAAALERKRAEERLISVELAELDGELRRFEGRRLNLASRSEQLQQLNAELDALRSLQHQSTLRAGAATRFSVVVPAYPLAPERALRGWPALGVLLAAGLAALLTRWGVSGAVRRAVAAPPAAAFNAPAEAPQPLAVASVRELLRCSDEAVRLLTMLLLSGVRLREVPGLRWYHLSADFHHLSVPSLPPRELPLGPQLSAWLERRFAGPAARLQPLLADADGHPLSPDQLSERLEHAARQARLREGATLSAARLEYTYLAFLAEQGVGLQQLEQRLGALPLEQLDRLDGLRPAGAERLLEEVNPIYPGLA